MKAIAPSAVRIPNGHDSLPLWTNTSARRNVIGFKEYLRSEAPSHLIVCRFARRQFLNRRSSVCDDGGQRGAAGHPGGGAPEQRVKAAAMRAARHPFEALPAAAAADMARIGHRVDGAVEPAAHRVTRAVLGLFETSHQQAQARGRAGKTALPASAWGSGAHGNRVLDFH